MQVTFTAEWLTEGASTAPDGGGCLVTGTEDETGNLVTVRIPDDRLRRMCEQVYGGAATVTADLAEAAVTGRKPLRMIVVPTEGGRPTREQVVAYLPAGYQVAGGKDDTDVIVAGHDLNNFTAEWTADRLRSGMIGCRILGGYVAGEVH